MQITIELGNETKNINPWIEPLGAARRGRWRRARLPLMNLADAEVAGLPDVPGYRIAVDIDKKEVRVFDPLAKKPRPGAIETALRRFFKRPLDLEGDQITNDQSPGTIQRWLIAMKRLVDAKLATVVDGKFPPSIEAEIRAERAEDAKAVGMKIEPGDVVP
ncbi:MAG TPA: hypothetical protein VFW87_08055 [Pirellulales bacterium]|nr:hypothetical protein [Pirellulales bacterium]